jgi:hypothetical protein
MINVQLNENDLFKIMLGSTQDRVDLLLCESMMEKLDLKTIKNIVEYHIKQAKKNGSFDNDKLTEVLMVIQVIAYNRHKCQESEKLATYLFDKLFEIITKEF